MACQQGGSHPPISLFTLFLAKEWGQLRSCCELIDSGAGMTELQLWQLYLLYAPSDVSGFKMFETYVRARTDASSSRQASLEL